MSKPTRSDFIQKLHNLLEEPYDPDNLRWTVDGAAFEISTNDAKARAALSTKWEFRSLSSFVRQLSYYGFRRLSDRRRSGERRTGVPGYIVFAHPSGLFVRGDPSSLSQIVRKLRNRVSKQRRVSGSSAASNDRSDESPPPPVPQWKATEYEPPQPNQRQRSASHPYAPPLFNSPFGPPRTVGEQTAALPAGPNLPAWKSYIPPAWSFSGSTDNSGPSTERGNSVSDYKISATISPRTSLKPLDLHRPPERYLPSSTQSPYSFNVRQHQQEEDPPISPTSYRPAPYPTPTYTAYSVTSSAPTAYTSHTFTPTGLPVPASYASYANSHLSAPPGSSSNPLPSPTYSSDGERTSNRTQQQQHMDPRALELSNYGGQHHYFAQRPSATPSHMQEVTGWAQAATKPVLGSMDSGYGSFSRHP